MTTPLDSAGPAATYLFRRTDPLRALVLDLDALADLRFDGYRAVFNAAFAALGLPVQWSVERYRQLLALPDERLRVAAELRKRCIGTDCDVLVRVLVEQVCETKEALLQRVMLDAGLSPRTGLNDLVTDAFVAQVPIAVITDGRRRWAQPLVSQLVGAGLVEAVVTADDIGVPPRGDALIRQALVELGVAPHDALAIVGSATGLRPAAGPMPPTARAVVGRTQRSGGLTAPTPLVAGACDHSGTQIPKNQNPHWLNPGSQTGVTVCPQ
ncbi:HAD family hydrolase [Mycolicibacterium neoaurum]|uniref:HAD-superfamily hydrolase n=1 Tax=Mycolicibacterium neoaurum TaxID=1795 RepID=A0AAV2WR67_MYCNE|nr:haloacid dehalogenase [Mycolicibacterium neoaurum]CDQ46819.1 HAD-superfamily hydrolase [Mycolicibacterium neoaurum]